MFIASKNSAEFKAPWPEKNLFSTEYGGNQVHTGTKMLQRRYVVPPKFIFYKNSHPRLYRVHKVFYIGRPVKRQIQDGICHRIIFAHFISRRRKKRQQDFGLRVFASKTFHERTPLLNFLAGLDGFGGVLRAGASASGCGRDYDEGGCAGVCEDEFVAHGASFGADGAEIVSARVEVYGCFARGVGGAGHGGAACCGYEEQEDAEMFHRRLFLLK